MKILTPTVLTYVKVLLIVAVVPAIVGFVIVLAERRFMAFMQVRLGPNRVGPKGTLQGLADLVKLVTKEDVTPSRSEKIVHFLAPVLAVIPALTALAVIPMGPSVRLARRVSTPVITASRRPCGSPTSTSACCFCSRSLRSASTASSWEAGPPTTNTPFSAGCARRPSSSPTKSRWGCRSWRCC